MLHLTYGLDFGGVETHLSLIASAPGKRHDHLFCGIAGGGAAEAAIRAEGGEVHIVGTDPWKNPIKSIRALKILVDRLSPDLVHCHGSEANIFGLMAASIARTPVRIGEEIGIPNHSWRARLAMRGIYATATHVIAVADAVRQWLVANGEVPARKISCVYSPVRLPDVLAAPRKPGERLRIAYLGRLDAVKNPISLVRAMELLRRSGCDCELSMIGDGPERASIERAIRSAGLDPVVHMHGFVPAPAALLARSHLLVQPSLSEGLSIALVEAMGCGLPAVSTAVGGSPEVIQAGATGWLLRSSDPESIAGAIRLANELDPEALAAMGRAGRASVRERFSTARYIAEIESLYDELCSAEGRG